MFPLYEIIKAFLSVCKSVFQAGTWQRSVVFCRRIRTIKKEQKERKEEQNCKKKG